MGYNTRYTITRFDGDVMAFAAAFNKTGSNGFITFFGVGSPSQAMKWYDHDEHIAAAMLIASADALTLRLDGESPLDHAEKEYRRDGDKVTMTQYGFELLRGPAVETKVINPQPGVEIRRG